MGDRDENKKKQRDNNSGEKSKKGRDIRSDSLLVRLNEKKDKGDRERQTTGAENPLGSSGVAKMMCEPVISRHAQSLKLWHLAWLSMIDIYLQIAVIHQCHISVGCETTN